jgi:hypothetical protein
MAGSVSTRPRQEADFRFVSVASQSQLSAKLGTIHCRPVPLGQGSRESRRQRPVLQGTADTAQLLPAGTKSGYLSLEDLKRRPTSTSRRAVSAVSFSDGPLIKIGEG